MTVAGSLFFLMFAVGGVYIGEFSVWDMMALIGVSHIFGFSTVLMGVFWWPSVYSEVHSVSLPRVLVG